MKRLIAAGIVAAMTWLGAAFAVEIVDGVAAIVNDRVITYSEIRSYVQPVVQQLRRTYSGQELLEKVRAAQMDALNTLIERALIIQEFHQKGFTLPESVVQEQLNDVIANEFGGDRAAFVKTLQAQNMTLAQYREQIRDRIIVQAMRARKAQQQIVVSPFKIEKYYQDNIDQFKVGDQIKLRMIFIKKEQKPEVRSQKSEEQTNAIEQAGPAGTNEVATPPPVDPRRRLAEEILAKLDAGESFESMARVYSEGKESREGGDWGWIGRDILRQELNEVAFTLKPGQHSGLIETAEGYYILRVDDVKPAHTRPLAHVRDEIEKILLQQQRAKMQQDWVKDLRSKAYIRLF